MISTTRIELIARLANTYTYQETRNVLLDFLYDEWMGMSDDDLEDEVKITESILTGKTESHNFVKGDE